jgi:flagellar M-ring protein FliF
MALTAMWRGLGTAARWGLVAGVLVVLAVTAALAAWALRVDEEVLFSRLDPADAATLTRELERMKQPFRLEDDGSTILVDRSQVHQTRLRLMGRDLPLHGAVGFELFNDADLGMTEFAQRVNYQRALQGELTRTIVSLAEVRSARVHLAMPEEGLFRRERARPKASVTLSLRDGRSLRREQVSGIQRLVAAAVPGIEPRDVTLVSDRGVALSHDGDDAEGMAASSQRLVIKREIEAYLADKANAVLTRAFGPGRALASVDVSIDMRQVRSTTEDVTAPPAGPGDLPTGVVVRERETLRDAARGAAVAGPEQPAAQGSHREVEYQVGRRVENVVTAPGGIVRVQALAVVREPLDAAAVEQVRSLVAHAVGIVRERGDTVHVQAMGAATLPPAGGPTGAADEAAAAVADRPAPVGRPPGPPAAAGALQAGAGLASAGWMTAAAVLAAGLVVAWALLHRQRRRSGQAAPELSAAERAQALGRVRDWLAADGADPKPGGRP